MIGTIAMMSSKSSIQEIIEEIKSKIDVVDFVGSYVSLKKSGKYFKANCPFHQEKTPSFVVSPEIQRWQCFGACHEGGDIISFLMKWENIPFSEALKLLAERADISITSKLERAGFADSESEKRSKIFEINELAAKYYAYILKNHNAAEGARAYLSARSLPHGISEKFSLGYAPTGWDSLAKYLAGKGFKNEEIVSTGLGITTSRGIIDRFRGRLMFPISNTLGKVVGFSGRLLGGVEPNEKTGAKYVNTPETLVYHKRESLYGFSVSKDAIRKQNSVIVVEGEFDFLTPFSKGVENIVAIKGSAFTQDQLKILKRYCDRLILALDNDKAGQDALRKSIVEAAPFGFEVYVCEMPGGKDPDDAAREHLAQFKEAVAHPTPVFDYLFKVLSVGVTSGDAYSKKKFTENMAEYMLLVDNPIIRSHYVQKIAEFVASSSNAVEEVIESLKKKKKVYVSRPNEKNSEGTKSQESQKEIIQRELISNIYRLKDKDIFDKIVLLLDGSEFDFAPYKTMFMVWVETAKKSFPADISHFLTKLPTEIRSKAEELYLASSMVSVGGEKTHEAKEVYRLALNLKKHYAHSILKSDSNDATDDDRLRVANSMLKAVEKELQML